MPQNKLMKGRSTVISAYPVATILHADLFVMMDGGQKVA
jgi:ABC-type transport system involved in Fe-S cluster assembly fused permease/ATPase subunit